MTTVTTAFGERVCEDQNFSSLSFEEAVEVVLVLLHCIWRSTGEASVV